MKARQEARKAQLKKPKSKRGPAIRPFSQVSINKTIGLLATIWIKRSSTAISTADPARGRNGCSRTEACPQLPAA